MAVAGAWGCAEQIAEPPHEGLREIYHTVGLMAHVTTD